jgi:hypothetical protein
MEISIKNPCHENWNEMTPNEQGAFCNKCVKTVIDFSTKSLEEIELYFKNKSNKNVCGRFETSQLDSLSFDAFFKRFKLMTLTKRFAIIVFFTFGSWMFDSNSLVAQNSEHTKGEVQTVPKNQIMGGIRAVEPKKDTTKKQVTPNTTNKNFVKGKVKAKDKIKTKEPIDMKVGEVSTAPTYTHQAKVQKK